jgi:hypothetical protein
MPLTAAAQSVPERANRNVGGGSVDGGLRCSPHNARAHDPVRHTRKTVCLGIPRSYTAGL